MSLPSNAPEELRETAIRIGALSDAHQFLGEHKRDEIYQGQNGKINLHRHLALIVRNSIARQGYLSNVLASAVLGEFGIPHIASHHQTMNAKTNRVDRRQLSLGYLTAEHHPGLFHAFKGLNKEISKVKADTDRSDERVSARQALLSSAVRSYLRIFNAETPDAVSDLDREKAGVLSLEVAGVQVDLEASSARLRPMGVSIPTLVTEIENPFTPTPPLPSGIVTHPSLRDWRSPYLFVDFQPPKAYSHMQ